MSELIDRLLMHPVLDWLAQATVFVVVVSLIIVIFSAFLWGVT